MTSTIEVRAPSTHSDGTRSQVQRWLKAVGERIAEHEPLIEVETDKVTMEISAPASGVLSAILKHEQEEIEPGDLLAVIQPVETGPSVNAGTNADEKADSAAEVKTKAELAAQASPHDAGSALTQPSPARGGGQGGGLNTDTSLASRSSPAVRRLLSEHGLESANIRGTGAGGRISVDDVLAQVAHRTAAEHSKATEDIASIPGTRVPHSATRKRIAERMVESLLHTAPHVTTVFEADMSAVVAHRARHRAAFEQQGAALTFTAYFLAACVDAIREVPEVNSRWLPDALLVHESIDIGVGTAVPGKGLIVPVVRNVQSLDLLGIARELGDLVHRAREGRLTAADVRGGTFTISNHGVSGSLVAAPIVINQPQAAILGIGKLEKRVVVVTENGADRMVVQPRCYVTLTIDHRVLDGDRANRFLEVLVRRLESWLDASAA